MPTARAQVAKQHKAALNIGTVASQGGGTGLAQQDKAARNIGTSASQGAGTGSAQQHKAAQSRGTSASHGGGTGSPKQHKHNAAQKIGTSASHGGGTGSPSPSKLLPPPRERQSPATSETRSPNQKKKDQTGYSKLRFSHLNFAIGNCWRHGICRG